MPVISSSAGGYTAPATPAFAPSSTSARATSSATGAFSADRYEGPSRLLSAEAGEKLNWKLFETLRNDVDNGDGVEGVHWVEPTAFLGFTHELPGIKLVLDVGADVNEVRARIAEAFPEFGQYKLVNQWTRWGGLPAWIPFLNRRPVATFRLDTYPTRITRPLP